MGSIFSPKPDIPSAPAVQPKAAVRPTSVVNIGDTKESGTKKRVRRGVNRQRLPATVLGQEPAGNTKKTLLGQ
tara:strand:+ start:1089 stop:1307 length:219 start_codon:yes stop_codon:yes gene_type:complete